MHNPWPDQSVFLRPPPTDISDPLSDARFKTFELYKDGTITELYSYLDDALDFKELAEKLPGFRDEFCKQVGNERASALKTIRENAAFIFSDIDVPAKLWSAEAGEERAASVKFKSLLYGPVRTTVPKFPPILFNNQDTSTLLFFNPYQPKMIRATLFGPNSVIIDPENFKYTGGTVGMTWGVSRVNASCIAWSAMLGLLSVVTEAHISDNDSNADGDDEMTDMMTWLLLAGPSDLTDSMTPSRSASSSQTVTSALLVHEPNDMIHGALVPETTIATDLDTQNSDIILNETTQNKRGRGRGRGSRGRGHGGHGVVEEFEPRQTRTRTKHTQ
ncbi:hypothetical protein VKT23_017886 [Stygiomarasmius scandens]|uniref:Uncharacterized protein n=1 Tax=Marasmiellus scandens TaxID=2682957 RepID=A0ABR1IV75_9AGAR